MWWWTVFQAKGDATGPPRKGDSKVSSNSVKKAEERKRHERRLSTSASVKQESVDRKREEEEAGSGARANPLPYFSHFPSALWTSIVTFILCRSDRRQGQSPGRWDTRQCWSWGRSGCVRWGQGEGCEVYRWSEERRGKAPQSWGVAREEGASPQCREQPLLAPQSQPNQPAPWVTPPELSQQEAWCSHICTDTSEFNTLHINPESPTVLLRTFHNVELTYWWLTETQQLVVVLSVSIILRAVYLGMCVHGACLLWQDERERQKQREHERELREEDRRRRNEVLRQREIEKMHREEAMRLER
jgi:hypothetical protein